MRSDDAAGWIHTHKGFTGRPDVEISGAMRLAAERKAVVLFAGEAAQRHYRASSLRTYHAASDRAAVIDLMSYFSGSNRELGVYLKLLRIRAEELIESVPVWVAIDGVADLLIKKGSLTALEVVEVYRNSMKEGTRR